MKTYASNLLKLGVSALFLVLSACGSNNGTSAVPANGYGGYGNYGCTPGTVCTGTGLTASNGLIARGAGFDGSRSIELALNFVGQAGMNASVAYSGPYAAQGYLVLTQPLASSCPIPPGTYTIQGQANSGWQGGTNINLTLIASGPGGQVQMTLVNGFVSGRPGGTVTGPDGQPYENYVAGSLIFANCSWLPVTVGN